METGTLRSFAEPNPGGRLLEDIVSRQLIADVPLCTLLSEGMDSSVITALSQRALAAQGAGPLRSFAVDFVNNARDFTPDEVRATPDAPFVRDVAAHVQSHHTDIVLSAGDLAATHVRAAVLHARDLPISMGDMDPSMHLLFRAIRQHSTVALSGESADEVFGGYSWFHDPSMAGRRASCGRRRRTCCQRPYWSGARAPTPPRRTPSTCASCTSSSPA